MSCSRFHSRRRFLFAYSRKSKCCSYEANSRSSCGALSNLGEALPWLGESRTVANGGGGEGILCGLLFTGMSRCLGAMATIRPESGLFVAARLFLEEVGAFFAVVVVLLLLIERRSLKSESSSVITPFWPGQNSPLYTHHRLVLEMTVTRVDELHGCPVRVYSLSQKGCSWRLVRGYGLEATCQGATIFIYAPPRFIQHLRPLTTTDRLHARIQCTAHLLSVPFSTISLSLACESRFVDHPLDWFILEDLRRTIVINNRTFCNPYAGTQRAALSTHVMVPLV